jgi:hypothetical protein
VLGYVYIRMLLSGMASLHVEGIIGLPGVLTAGVLQLFGAVFLLRLLGVWSYRSRPAEPAEPTQAETTPDVTDPAPITPVSKDED